MKQLFPTFASLSVSILFLFGSCAPKPAEPAPMDHLVADEMYEQDDTLPEDLQPIVFTEDSSHISDCDFVVLADVVPDIIQEIRYYSTYNFIGRHIPGYDEPVALMTRRAADSLRRVSDDVVAQGYRLKVFDAYRPTTAVRYFVRWGKQLNDTLMKRYFYPEVNKADVFHLGYLASRSAHSRGSTIDLTLFDMTTEREVDMGGTYDFFGDVSHPSYTKGLTAEQLHHRQVLRQAMIRHGFKPVSTEWWHFTLRNEPCPDQYFDFPVSVRSISAATCGR